MPKTKVQKQKMLSDLGEKITRSKTAVFVNFSGIPVKEINFLRTDCKKQDIGYKVTKKTLLKKALQENGFEDFSKERLTGEVAAILGFSDEVAPAKLVASFIKDHDKMKILGGIFGGQLVEAEKIVALSKLPSKTELMAKLVGSLASPLSGLVNVLQGNLRGLVCVLNGIREKKSV